MIMNLKQLEILFTIVVTILIVAIIGGIVLLFILFPTVAMPLTIVLGVLAIIIVIANYLVTEVIIPSCIEYKKKKK